VSTDQEKDSVALFLPAPFTERTEKVCSPSSSCTVRDTGLWQGSTGWPSSSHSKNTSLRVEENRNSAVFTRDHFDGPESMRTSGRETSTLQAWVTATSSELPCRSMARTEKTYAPSLRFI
jgi:hypothetical protein